MAGLVDLSLIIIALAVAGFIFKEVFYFYRKFCTPYVDNSTGDNTFGYISIAVFIIGTCWVAIIYSGVLNPESIENFFKPLFQGLQTFVDLRLISDTEMTAYVAKATLGLFLFSWLSVLFIYALFITLILGIISIYMDKSAIQIDFVDTEKPSQKYKRIIKESNDFIYFEILDNFRKWESVKKTEISTIKNIVTKSKFEEKLQQNMPIFIQKHSLISDGKKRRTIIIIFLFATLVIAIFTGVTEFALIKTILIIFCVPTLFLITIDVMMRETDE